MRNGTKIRKGFMHCRIWSWINAIFTVCLGENENITMMRIDNKEYFLTPLIKLLPSRIDNKEKNKSKLQQKENETARHDDLMVQIGSKKNNSTTIAIKTVSSVVGVKQNRTL